MMRGGELWPLMLFDPHTVLGSSQLALLLLALPQQGAGTWDQLGAGTPVLCCSHQNLSLLVAFLKQKTGPEPPNLEPNLSHLP